MIYRFSKMHGAGNDFVVIPDMDAVFPIDDPDYIRLLCDPHTGLGTEGFIVLRPDEEADFRMIFFNPDGSRASMCGNGARCAAFYAFSHGIAARLMRFRSDAGMLSAEILEDTPGRGTVKVRTTLPRNIRASVAPTGSSRSYFSVDTGVPHAVAFLDNLSSLDVAAEGRAVRFAPEFAPAGTNVDFVRVVDRSTLELRTYERGVEAETAACGTGALASAVAAIESGVCDSSVSIRVRFGDTLGVDLLRAPDGSVSAIYLTGPAVVVCEGSFDDRWT